MAHLALLWLLLALAQAAPVPPAGGAADPTAGVAGWTGAVSLGGVLTWLLFWYLPRQADRQDAKDRAHAEQIKSLMEGHAKELQEKAEQHAQALMLEGQARRADFKGALDAVLANCKSESALLKEILEKDIAENNAAVTDLRRTLEDLRQTMLARGGSSGGRGGK